MKRAGSNRDRRRVKSRWKEITVIVREIHPQHRSYLIQSVVEIIGIGSSVDSHVVDCSVNAQNFDEIQTHRGVAVI